MTVACAACSAEVIAFQNTRITICPSCGKDFQARKIDQPPELGTMRGVRLVPEQQAPLWARSLPAGPTLDLPPLGYTPPPSLDAVLSVGGSPAGLSAVGQYILCPEMERLRALGVQRRRSYTWADYPLPKREFGTLMHALLTVRRLWGTAKALEYLAFLQPHFDDQTEAQSLLYLYEENYPLEREPFRLLAVECEIWTDVGTSRLGRPGLRSLRFDYLIQAQGPGNESQVWGVDYKTSSRGGDSTWDTYAEQQEWYTACWNYNRPLREKYGYMPGVILDTIVRTKTPQFERIPRLISESQQQKALIYMRDGIDVQFPAGAHPCPFGTGQGAFRNHKACHGSYGQRCTYWELCHEDSAGEYEIKESE